jgi:hypothetical protein
MLLTHNIFYDALNPGKRQFFNETSRFSQAWGNPLSFVKTLAYRTLPGLGTLLASFHQIVPGGCVGRRFRID